MNESPTPFTIAPLTPQEVPEIVALAREIWHRHYPGIITPQQIDYMLDQRYTLARLSEELGNPFIHWDVANELTAAGRAVGFSSTVHLPDTDELKLDKLYVRPEMHGCGIGRALVELAIERGRQADCDALVLAVNKHNEKAILAYLRFGFVIRETLSTDIGGGFVMDDFIMAHSL